MQIYNHRNCKESIGNLQMHNLITALLRLKDKHYNSKLKLTKMKKYTYKQNMANMFYFL